MTNERPLEGRVGIVTGASSGIGAATARVLAAAGMKVMLGARRAARLEELCLEIRSAGGVAAFLPTDMREERQVEALVDETVARFGHLDAIVNNAAVGFIRTVAEGRTDEWRTTLDTNVMGTLYACRAALRHMLPQGRGDILNVGSASANAPWPYLAAYAATKAAILELSLSLRAEVASRGIRVMTVDIHNVATEFGNNFDPDLMMDAATAWQRTGVFNPQAEILDASNVGRAVLYQLAQPDPVTIFDLSIRSRAS